jgi:hypothetical protein
VYSKIRDPPYPDESMEPFPEFKEPQLPPPPKTNFMPLIIAGVAFTMLVIVLSLTMDEEPVFKNIDDVSVHYLSNKGLTQRSLSSLEKSSIIDCLLSNTQNLDKAELEKELLPSTYLLEVRNGDGSNSLELISRNNLADNRGYYQNNCIYGLIQ